MAIRFEIDERTAKEVVLEVGSNSCAPICGLGGAGSVRQISSREPHGPLRRSRAATPASIRRMPVLQIPRQLRAYCGGLDSLELEGERASELLAGLALRFPELGSRVLDASGALAPHIVLIQNDVVLRAADIAEARFSDGDEIRLFTAASGG